MGRIEMDLHGGGSFYRIVAVQRRDGIPVLFQRHLRLGGAGHHQLAVRVLDSKRFIRLSS